MDMGWGCSAEYSMVPASESSCLTGEWEQALHHNLIGAMGAVEEHFTAMRRQDAEWEDNLKNK